MVVRTYSRNGHSHLMDFGCVSPSWLMYVMCVVWMADASKNGGVRPPHHFSRGVNGGGDGGLGGREPDANITLFSQ